MTREDRIARILGAWQEDRDEGRFVDPASLCAGHPDLADELRLRFAALNIVERAYAETRMFSGEAPRRLGEYEIKRELGRGGMGVVYEAVQSSMDRTVALKVLFPSVTSSRRAVERFQREARAAGRVQHTNIVPVYTLSREEGTWYYAMELVEGSSLSRLLREKRALEEEPGDTHGDEASGLLGTRASASYHRDMADLFAGVSEALQAAHEEGVIHRDVKPSNLILDDKGVLKVVDFGIARIQSEVSEMTVTGELLGTPVYMSPEQARGTKGGVDHLSDIYSLGATLYEALTLRPPYDGRTFGDVYEKILTTEPLTPRQRDRRVPRDLETVVLKAMEKEKGRRYESAGALARDLRAFAAGRAIGARRVSAAEHLWRRVKRHRVLTTAALLLLGVIVTSLVLARRASDEQHRRRDAEYALLLRRAVEVLPSDHSAGYTTGGAAVNLYGRAIGVLPGRPEAYVGRALTAGRSVEERLADVASARGRGVRPSTADRLRAVVLHASGRAEEALALEVGLPSGREAGDRLDALILGIRANQRGRPVEAIEHLGRAITDAQTSSLAAYLARRERARLLLLRGRLEAALDDLHATRAQGDRGPGTSATLASVWKRLGQTDKAESLVSTTLAQGLSDVGSWDTFIRTCLQNSDLEWAGRAGRLAVAAHPEDGVLRSLHGNVLTRQGEVEEALRELRRGVELAPDHGLANALYALTLSDVDRIPEADEYSARAVQLAPRHPWVLQIRAFVLRVAKQYPEAYAEAEKVLKIDPTRTAALLLQGFVLQDQGELDRAQQRFEAALAIAPHEAPLHAAMSNLHKLRGNKVAARDSLKRALRRAPDHHRYHYNMGVLHSDLGEHEQALERYRTALRLRPDYAQAAYNLANALASLDRWDDALRAYRDVIPLDEDYPNLWMEIGTCLWRLGDKTSALAAYDKELALHPTNLNARANKASLLDSMGKRELALREFNAILEKRPTLGIIWFNKGLALRALQRPEEALEAFTEAAKFMPKSPDPSNWRAMILEHLGRKDEAESAWRDALRIAPRSPDAHYNLGMFLAQNGKADESRELAAKCLAIDATYAKAHNLIGQLQRRANADEAALPSLRRAIELDEKHRFEWFRKNLAEALIHLGRYPEAADVLDEAAQHFPKSAHLATWLALVLSSAPDARTRAPARAVKLARGAAVLPGANTMTRLALAAALHRSERHAEALGVVEEARAKGSADPLGNLIEALAYHALGKDASARAKLRATDGKIDDEDPRPATDIARVLRAEATRLIEGE